MVIVVTKRVLKVTEIMYLCLREPRDNKSNESPRTTKTLLQILVQILQGGRNSLFSSYPNLDSNLVAYSGIVIL
jgi:hypothetical protein